MDHTTSPDTSVTVAVVEAVSSFENCEPTDLPPLHDVIDPDALNALFDSSSDRTSGRVGSVSFEFSDSSVTVEDGQTVTVESRQTRSVTA